MSNFPEQEPTAGKGKSILALDIATVCGFARVHPTGRVFSGSNSFKPLAGASPGYRFYKWEKWVKNEINVNRIEYVAYEIVKQVHRTRSSAAVYHGMVSIMLAACEAKGIKTKGYTVQEIKRAATGKGAADKAQMISTARQQFPDQVINDDNQADALWILYLACKDLGIGFEKHQGELF
jgi:Holliday junction resolvasome RuvABC endonuclease subunit